MGLASHGALIVAGWLLLGLIIWAIVGFVGTRGRLSLGRALINILFGAFYVSMRLNTAVTRPPIFYVTFFGFMLMCFGAAELVAHLMAKHGSPDGFKAKRMKGGKGNSLIVGFILGGLLAGILLGLGGYRYLNKTRDTRYKAAVKVPVIVAKEDLHGGTILQIQHLAVKSVYKSALGDNVFLSEDLPDLLGLRTTYPIERDSPILKSQLEIPKKSVAK
jgi:hypothetical protein